jgi:hypothetical protein
MKPKNDPCHTTSAQPKTGHTQFPDKAALPECQSARDPIDPVQENQTPPYYHREIF